MPFHNNQLGLEKRHWNLQTFLLPCHPAGVDDVSLQGPLFYSRNQSHSSTGLNKMTTISIASTIRDVFTFQGDFKREDLARATLKYIVLDVVQTVHLICQLQGIKRVFLTGSFCNTSLVRQVMTTEFARRNITQFMFTAGAVSQRLTIFTSPLSQNITFFRHHADA